MIDKIAFIERPVQGFVTAATNLRGSANEKLVVKGHDLMQRFIHTDFSTKGNHRTMIVEFVDPAVSYARSHGQKLNVIAG